MAAGRVERQSAGQLSLNALLVQECIQRVVHSRLLVRNCSLRVTCYYEVQHELRHNSPLPHHKQRCVGRLFSHDLHFDALFERRFNIVGFQGLLGLFVKAFTVCNSAVRIGLRH